MKVKEKGMYLVPSEQTLFEMKHNPISLRDLKASGLAIVDKPKEILGLEKLNTSESCVLIRSEVYFDKYYSPEEFDFKNTEDVAFVTHTILGLLGASNIEQTYVTSDKKIYNSLDESSFGVGVGYKIFGGEVKHNSSSSNSSVSQNKLEKEKKIGHSGKSASKEYIYNYIKEHNIDTTGLPSWVRSAIETHDINPIKSFRDRQYKLSYNQQIKNQSREINGKIKAGFFGASIKTNFSSSSTNEHTYFEEIIFNAEFGEK